MHLQCIETYEKMKPLLYDLHVANQPEDWVGWGALLEAVGMPRDDDEAFDMESPPARVWWHCVHNLGRLLRMMEATRAA